jgi:hypothetical protein
LKNRLLQPKGSLLQSVSLTHFPAIILAKDLA